MPRLPILSGQEVIRILYRHGFRRSTHQGDHVTLIKVEDGTVRLVTVPLYREISRGLLHRIVTKQAGMTEEELFSQR